jgi:uncharacterized protein YjbI with pentapeptide repeats/ABC-type sugar transport system substrate-binding protein
MEPGSAPSENASLSDVELDELLESFAGVMEIGDPVRRRVALRREAKRLDLEVEHYSTLFDLYNRRQASRWFLERYAEKLVDWFESLSFFSLLEYVGRLAIVMAILSFFLDLPERNKQQEYATWRAVESASGKVYSRARIGALERLNEDCVSLEGLNARGAYLRNLHLDRCYGVPGGSLLGRWAPWLFQRQGAVLLGADLAGAYLENARLPAADLRRVVFAGAYLSSADLAAARLEEADLGGADLFRADLRGARLSGADLRNADLSNANLQGADLTKARLQGARLVGADLRGARLRYAQLQRANLSRSDLRRANLFDANLSGAWLRKAWLDERTVLESADIRQADFRGVVLPMDDHFRSARNWTQVASNPMASATSVTLGLVLQDEQHFFQEIERGVRRAAGQEVRIIVRMIAKGAGTRLENEAAIVRELIRLGADGIVLVPQDERRSVPILRQAFDAGLVIATYDHSLNPGGAARLLAANYESDQFELGRETGKALAGWLKRQPDAEARRVGILKYCDFEGCYRRVEGFRAALDASGIVWKEAGYRGHRGRETSAGAADDLIGSHPDLHALWSANESGTEGLIAAIHARGLQGRAKVWGTDISPPLARMLLDDGGILQAVTGQRPEEMGYRAAAAALAVIQDRVATPFQSETVGLQLFSREDPERVRSYLGRHDDSGGR